MDGLKHVLVTLPLCLVISLASAREDSPRPNIIFAIADDWGMHASVLGEPVLQTPTFDKLAQTGVLFEHAYVSAPSCTPSRNAVLTGQFHWRLGSGANLWSTLPLEHKVYPHLLMDAGYHIGHNRKSYGPGQVTRNIHPAGPHYKSFDEFMAACPEDKPFCYWFGTSDPHRGYKLNSGAQSGMDIDKIRVPPFFPNTPEVRGDMADYFFEVQRYDREFGEVLDKIEAMGKMDNTIVVMTSDHGMPFPRCKANLYDSGTQVPLVIRYPGGAAGRRVKDFVSLVDIAPTFLDAAGLEIPPEMSGMSLVPVLQKTIGEQWKPRSGIVVGKERHVPCQEDSLGGYPCRALRTHEFMIIKNYEPDRWPSGTPDDEKAFFKKTWLGDCDNSPTKSIIVDGQSSGKDGQRFYDLCFGKRPAIEFYDIKNDPHQLHNLAENPEYESKLKEMKAQLESLLKQHGDPRELGGAEKFDTYPYSGGTPRRK
jgi:arylsulfatase A-like enzyme